jgi:hypothetical protein
MSRDHYARTSLWRTGRQVGLLVALACAGLVVLVVLLVFGGGE